MSSSISQGFTNTGSQSSPSCTRSSPPELVGHTRRIVIGPGSGRHGIHLKIEQVLGRTVEEEDPRLDDLVTLVREELEKNLNSPEIERDVFQQLMVKAGFKD